MIHGRKKCTHEFFHLAIFINASFAIHLGSSISRDPQKNLTRTPGPHKSLAGPFLAPLRGHPRCHVPLMLSAQNPAQILLLRISIDTTI